jgi:hypothetical protein
MGATEQNIARMAHLIGQPMPERIANAPELQLGLGLYLQAFFDLDSERSHGMSLTRIPWSSVKDYAIAFEFNEQQTEDLFYYIKRLDGANLQYLADKMPKP